eukprot:scaffold1922_cov101-Isochrysis_galbana.AAC.10
MRAIACSTICGGRGWRDIFCTACGSARACKRGHWQAVKGAHGGQKKSAAHMQRSTLVPTVSDGTRPCPDPAVPRRAAATGQGPGPDAPPGIRKTSPPARLPALLRPCAPPAAALAAVLTASVCGGTELELRVAQLAQ